MDDDRRRLDEDAEVAVHVAHVEDDAALVDLHVLAEPAVQVVLRTGQETEDLAAVAELRDLRMELARVALAARLETRHDLVADLERLAREVRLHVLAERDDLARALVAELDRAELEGIALVFVDVCAADAAALDLDEDLVRADSGNVNRLQDHLLRRLKHRNLALLRNSHFLFLLSNESLTTNWEALTSRHALPTEPKS